MLISEFLSLAFTLSGRGEGFSAQVIENNEIFIQSISLLLGIWLVFGKASSGALKASIGDSLGFADGSTTLKFRRLLTEALGPAAKAFSLASIGVALCLSFGLFRLEGPVLDLSWIGVWSPLWLLRAFSFFLWVLVLEMTRHHLMKALLFERGTELIGRMALILFEGYLIFKVFRLPGETLEQGLVAAVSIWVAALMQIWTGYRVRSRLAAWKRTIALSIFLITIFGVYGLPFSWGRSVSLYSALSGGDELGSVAMGLLIEPYLLGNVIFIGMLTLLSCFMLRRVHSRTL